LLICRSAPIRCALACGSKESLFFDSYPALVPQRATRLGTVPGYYQSSRGARDWIALLELGIAERRLFHFFRG